MADILCKLKLVTDNYESNLKKSRQQMQEFTKKTQDARGDFKKFESTIGTARSSFLKFAGGIGLAITAGEGLEKMMRSNQTTSDLFDNNINAAKDSVDLFFKSLTTGDWTPFENGLIGAFESARDLSAMMDELADKKLSLSFIKADDLKDLKRFEQVAKDSESTIAEQKDAVQNMQGVVNHLNKKTKETIDFELETLNKNYANKSGLNINADDVRYFAQNTNFSGDATAPMNEAYKKYVKLNNEAAKLKKSFDYEVKNFGFDPTTKAQKAYLEKKKELELYQQENGFLIKQGWLTEENDEARKKSIETLIAQSRVMEEMSSLQLRVDLTERRVNSRAAQKEKAGKAGNKAKQEKPVEVSIDYINAQISDLTKKLNAETDGAVRAALKMAIDKFNKEKHRLELYTEISPLESKKVVGKKASDAAEEKVSPIANKKLKPAITPKDVKVTNQYNESLGHTLSMLLAIGNATNEGAAGWITYGVNSLTALNSTYQALAAVIPALQVKALVAGAASAAETPIIGWITAIAAIGAMSAAFASLPKYETGGIVGVNGGIIPGASFSGDKILARVNSGELILNRAQQKNIASQLVAGGSASRIDVNVVGRISGRDLELVQEKRNQFKRRTQ
ncbi:hypothetical protein [uncultured Parabacteroides sp.]|jgi:hypothetical protein|uniref:hypothetical protein n=1 Tax=uncultured Parabacteroides sp. TaxID=512312 RepID=UPI0025EB6858|nr:hypothetical protein [uncultured Parabacteroides sp.]